MKKVLIGSLVLFVILNSCAKNSSSGSCNPTYDACSVIAPEYEIDSVAKYLITNGLYDSAATKEHCSGFFYKIDSVGTGNAPTICSTITVKYQGRLKDGTTFDQSNGLSYPLAQFILGFRNGLMQIKTGGKIHLYIPPSLAYGNQAVGNIPPGSMLIFDVTLLSVQD
ncbi:MAG: FKBP-type peptidyl-prolyl cis-trans isomerase [Bacteroidota bacterium]